MNTPFGNDLTKEQQEAVAALRKQVFEVNQRLVNTSGDPAKDRVFSDDELARHRSRWYEKEQTLVRFLIARNWNVPQAVDMFQNYLKWRTEMNIDGMRPEKDYPTQVKTEMARIGGVDKRGRPSFIVTPAKLIPGSYDVDELGRVFAHVIEIIAEHFNPPNDKITLIFDYDGWGLGNIDTSLDRKLMGIAQNYFPELLGEAHLLYPPWYFRGAWAVFKLLLDEKTASKVNMYGSDYKEKIAALFDKDQLPELYGGTFKPISIEDYVTSHIDTFKKYYDNANTASNPGTSNNEENKAQE